jgi:hypothetical protein
MSTLIAGHKFMTKYPAEGEPLFKAWVAVEQEGWIVAVHDTRHPDGPNAPPLHESYVDDEDEGKARAEKIIQQQISRDGLKREALIWHESNPAQPAEEEQKKPGDGERK